MSDMRDPLRVEYGPELRGLALVRQSPPAGAASFSATYVGPAGYGYEPPAEAGIARVVNLLLTSGAGRYDRIALARLLDGLGATLTSECDSESAEVTVWGPADAWRTLLSLLADAVLRPRFASADLVRVRRQLIERQLRELTQPGSRADRELFRAIYPDGHPYRTSGLGDRQSAKRLTTTRLRAFHRRHYTSGGATLVVTGPPSMSELYRTAARLFDGLAESSPPSLSVPEVRSVRPRRIVSVLRGRSQSEIRIGGNSIARSSPVYAAAFLANEVLGGRAQLSRLFQKVREQGGLVYHASSELEAMRHGGHWMVGAGTAPERADRVVRLLETELVRLRASTVSAAELAEIRESAIGEIPLALESTADAHELAVDVAYHQLPGDYLLQLPKTLRGITGREVRAAAEEAMDSSHAVTVLAGSDGRR